MPISRAETGIESAVVPVEKMAATRWATQGAAFFLVAMVAVVLAGFYFRGETPLSPVVTVGVFFLFFVVIRLWVGGSLWPALVGGMAGAVAVVFNADLPQELPLEAFGSKHVLQGLIVDRQDRYDSVLLELSELAWPERGWESPDRVRLSVEPQKVGPAQPGDRIAAVVRLRRPMGSQVPGASDYGIWLRGHGFVATGYVSGPSVTILESTRQWFWNRVRHQISQWIVSRLPRETVGLSEGILVGKRGRIEATLSDAMQVSGTYHLLAISGQHLAMVAGWSFLLIRWILVLWIPISQRWDMKRLAALLTLIPLIVYSLLAGWSVSTQRATLMAGLMFLGIVLWRRTASLHSLILSAIVLLLLWPRELFSAGFQLSYSAVAGLILFFNTFPMKGHFWYRFGLFIGVTLFMGIVTAPIVAFHFHRFSPYGFFGNLFAVPWVSFLSVPLGLGALLMHGVVPSWGDGLLDWMAWSMGVFARWVEWIALWPDAWQRLPGPSLWGISWSVVLLAASFIWPWRRGRFFWVVMGLLALFWPRQGPIAGRLHMACLDVGQAMAGVIRDPEGRWMLVDAGGTDSPRFNVGEGLVSAYLWHQNVRELERIIISHPQKDHMGGVRAVMRNFPVKELWLGHFPDEEKRSYELRRIMEMATQKGVTIRRIDHPFTQNGIANWEVFTPEMDVVNPASVNDRSLIVRMTMGSHHFLFPGDIGAKGEKWLVKRYPHRHYSVVVAPHHGSKTSSTPDFVATLHPQHVVFSSGAVIGSNRKIPHPEVLARWQESGARLWRTDRQGTVIWETDGRNLWFQPEDRGG
ncbi:MAG: DNA internalization-related competence protein ComEC/Rec2 [Magnetococcales bacterium]|nr:DNA internalization-related competence protein ComEC/Rec2 [Magnetococcales bacterium]